MLLALLSFIGCTVRNMIVEEMIESTKPKPKPRAYLINRNKIVKVDFARNER